MPNMGDLNWKDILGGFGLNIDPDEFKPQPHAHKPLSTAQKVIIAIIAVLVVAFAYWWFHPAINIHSVSMWWFIAIVILLPAFLGFRYLSHKAEEEEHDEMKAAKKSTLFHRLSFLPVIIVVLVLIGAVASWSIIPGNAARYANILQTEECDFASDIEEVDYNQIPVIDHDSAELLGNRTLGEIPEYVSQFEISDLYSQINYQGTPVRVSPLGYADFFKWLNQQATGLPGYVLVDMTTQDTQVVRDKGSIFYSQSEPFDRNIDRYVQLAYPFKMFAEKSFEIDENGHPWWVCPVLDYTIGLFGGQTIKEAVLVDAETGEHTLYNVEDIPEWVDRVYPSDMLITQYNWSGLYLNGWLNSWLGQTGVKQTTPGTNGLDGYNYIAKDDDVWLYTGVTSATADNSIIGFVLINQRTSESHFYSVSGATESSAMSSAEGQVQNLRYTATFPLLLNINNQPTYFMALKDSAGLVKKFAMIDIQRYQNVATGDTVSECQKAYKSLLASNGVSSGSSGSSDGTVTSGTIETMAQAVIDGNSHYYLTLKDDDHIYDVALPGLIEIVGYQVGDKITLRYIEDSPTCTVDALGDSAKSLEEATSTSTDESTEATANAGADSAAISFDATQDGVAGTEGTETTTA